MEAHPLRTAAVIHFGTLSQIGETDEHSNMGDREGETEHLCE